MSQFQAGDYLGIYTHGWFDVYYTQKNEIDKFDVYTHGWFELIKSVSAFPESGIINLSAHQPDCVVITERFHDWDEYSPLPSGWLRKCPTNEDYDSERELYRVLNMEMINIWGVPCVYYPVNHHVYTSADSYNEIFGEDSNPTITTAYGNITSGSYRYDVMAMFKLPKENRSFRTIGIAGLEQFPVYISKEHFSNMTNNYIPQIGDLIRPQYSDKIYEITEVENTYSQFGHVQYTWTLFVKVFDKEHRDVSVLSATDPLRVAEDSSDIFDISDKVDDKKGTFIHNPLMENVDKLNSGWY